MKQTKVRIGGKIFNVKVAETSDELQQGLKGVKRLKKSEGMLFDFGQTGNYTMVMDDTLIPLDQIFISPDQEVIQVESRQPEDGYHITVNNTRWVLELNANSGIQEGDYLEFNDDIKKNWGEYTMKVLAPDGSYQFALKGGERIFSRISTKRFIKYAKRANKSKLDKDYASLGRAVFNELSAQTDRGPEFVEAPN